MVGNSRASPPRSAILRERMLACRRALVTRIRRPKKGSFSNHSSFWRRETTSPTMITAGDVRPAARTFSPISSRVPVTTSCSGRVPQRMTAVGVEALLHFSCRLAVISGRFSTPIRNINVPGSRAKRLQSI